MRSGLARPCETHSAQPDILVASGAGSRTRHRFVPWRRRDGPRFRRLERARLARLPLRRFRFVCLHWGMAGLTICETHRRPPVKTLALAVSAVFLLTTCAAYQAQHRGTAMTSAT